MSLLPLLCVYAHRHCHAGPLTSCLPMKSRNKKRELTFIGIRYYKGYRVSGRMHCRLMDVLHGFEAHSTTEET